MTKLQAVNQMLQTIGEAPVSALVGSGYTEASTALSTLLEASRDVQSEGFSFNTDYAFALQPDSTGAISIMSNVIKIIGVPSNQVAIAQRGARLYNRTEASYTFNSTILADITIELDFDELVQSAQQYIMVKAARIFQQRLIGSDTLFGYTMKDEQTARQKLLEFEIDAEDISMFDEPSINKINNRR